VTLATGRGFAPTACIAQELGLNAPLICYQGALIRDYRDGTSIHTAAIPLDLAQEVITISRTRRLNAQVYMSDGLAYAAQVTSDIAYLADITQVPVTEVGDLAAWLDQPPLKFLFYEPERDTHTLVGELQSRFNGRLQVVQSWDHLIEITGPDVSKGKALARLAAHLDVPRSATLAIGDQDNDVSMIAWAGVGVAMGNASPAAKAVADIVAPPLEEEGAAQIIEHYLLDEL
jgi:Cof subfamily protein (haloacid dehalogenase superfamily)